MLKAAGQGDAALTERLLVAGASPHAVNAEGANALLLACELGRMAARTGLVRLLLEAGAEARQVDWRGNTALHFAAGYGHTAVVRLLLDAGAEADALNRHGDTPLLCAVAAGQRECAECLLIAGANLEARGKQDASALLLALEPGRGAPLASLVRLLLASGAKVNAADRNGETALMKAAKQNRLDLTRLLLAAGADAELRDRRGKTALAKAMKQRHLEMVQLLLDCARKGSKTV